LRRRFIATGAFGYALTIWLARTILGGILYATAAFFTREGWERWKSYGWRRS